MDITAIEDAIYAWASVESGIETIIAYPNAPRPTTPYVVINIFSLIDRCEKEMEGVLQVDNSIDYTYSTLVEVGVSINTYYAGAYQNAKTLHDSLMKTDTIEALTASGLGLGRITAIDKTPEIIDNRWEERAKFDINFYVRSSVTENIESIQSIEITNDIDESTIII